MARGAARGVASGLSRPHSPPPMKKTSTTKRSRQKLKEMQDRAAKARAAKRAKKKEAERRKADRAPLPGSVRQKLKDSRRLSAEARRATTPEEKTRLDRLKRKQIEDLLDTPFDAPPTPEED